MKDLHLRTPAVGQRIPRTYLQRIEENASNVLVPDLGMTGRTLSAQVPTQPSTFKIYTCSLTADLLPGSSAAATLLIGANKATTGDAIIVKDVPTSITAGKKIAIGVTCRIFKDHDMTLAADEYAFLSPLTCETDQ